MNSEYYDFSPSPPVTPPANFVPSAKYTPNNEAITSGKIQLIALWIISTIALILVIVSIVYNFHASKNVTNVLGDGVTIEDGKIVANTLQSVNLNATVITDDYNSSSRSNSLQNNIPSNFRASNGQVHATSYTDGIMTLQSGEFTSGSTTVNSSSIESTTGTFSGDVTSSTLTTTTLVQGDTFKMTQGGVDANSYQELSQITTETTPVTHGIVRINNVMSSGVEPDFVAPLTLRAAQSDVYGSVPILIATNRNETSNSATAGNEAISTLSVPKAILIREGDSIEYEMFGKTASAISSSVGFNIVFSVIDSKSSVVSTETVVFKNGAVENLAAEFKIMFKIIKNTALGTDMYNLVGELHFFTGSESYGAYSTLINQTITFEDLSINDLKIDFSINLTGAPAISDDITHNFSKITLDVNGN